jgi:hypothetical protein
VTNLALQSAARGAEWLLDHLETGGRFQGDPPLTAYYKTPYAFLASGHPVEAERVLDFIRLRFLQPDGDLDGSGVPWYGQFRIYPHAWIASGALARGRFDIARPLIRFIKARQDPATGGFAADEQGSQEIMTGSVAALACLWSGDLDAALAAAGWLKRMFEAQPDLRRGLYHVWRNGLVTEFPAESATSYLVDATQRKQWYFQYGISAAFLAQLTAATGDNSWIDLGRRYLGASSHCQDDVYRQPQSGKIGWGSAWTYRVSRLPEDARYAAPVIDGLCALQTPDGSWHPGGVYEMAPGESVEPRIDITSEFVALQSEMGIITSA